MTATERQAIRSAVSRAARSRIEAENEAMMLHLSALPAPEVGQRGGARVPDDIPKYTVMYEVVYGREVICRPGTAEECIAVADRNPGSRVYATVVKYGLHDEMQETREPRREVYAT